MTTTTGLGLGRDTGREREREEILITTTHFKENSVALFLPLPRRAVTTYIAFSVNTPHRYLSEESLSSIMQTRKKHPDYILGRIVLNVRKLATAEDNPFGLENMTEYFLLTVEDLFSTLQVSIYLYLSIYRLLIFFD
jgi:hypothetical protein